MSDDGADARRVQRCTPNTGHWSRFGDTRCECGELQFYTAADARRVAPVEPPGLVQNWFARLPASKSGRYKLLDWDDCEWLLKQLEAQRIAAPPDLPLPHTTFASMRQQYDAMNRAITDAEAVADAAGFREGMYLAEVITTLLARIAAPPEGTLAPIPLNQEQEDAVKLWAADDRLWTTQETVEFNLRTFARLMLKLRAAAGVHPPQEK